MRSPSLARRAAAATLLALAAGCAPDRTPTAPNGRLAPPVWAGDPFVGDPNELLVLVEYLFVADEAAAIAEALTIVRNTPGGATACAATAALLDRTFANYRELKLYGQVDQNGPDLTFPRPVVQRLVQRLSLNCATLAPASGIPNGVLDVGGAADVIRAGDGGEVTTIPGPDGQAGVKVRPGTFTQDVVLYIVPKAPANLLPTTLPQSPPYYDIFLVPAQPSPFRFPLDLGFVVNWPAGAPSDHLVIGHEVTPGRLEVLQPTVLTTPASAVGQWGGPAYLRPLTTPTSPTLLPGDPAMASVLVGPMADLRGKTLSYGGQAGSLSPFGLVSIFQTGVNPALGVAFGTSTCVAGRATQPYTVTSVGDLVLNYQELAANGAAVGPRQLLYLAGRGTGAPRAGALTASSAAAARVRFFFGSTPFATRTLASCGSP